jgi:hypothetical protein
LWIAFFVVLSLSISEVFSLVLIDFVHGNPGRTQSNAVSPMFLFIPVIATLAYQAVVTVLDLLYSEVKVYRRSKWALTLSALSLVAVVGLIQGYRGAVEQYQFIDHPSR